MKILKHDEEKFLDMVKKAETIAICSHINPDGDAVGSAIGLHYALKSLGKKVYLIKNDPFPTNLTFMKDRDCYYEGHPIATDLFIVVDVAGIERIGSAAAFFELAEDSLCIDHHKTNGGFCKENIIYPEASSTCEIIASILEDLDLEVTPTAASFLYLGMLTDSYRFQYESTSPDTLRRAAFLLEKGADKMYINNNLYETLDYRYLLLQAEVIKEAYFNEDKTIVIGRLTKDTLKKYGQDFDTAESLVSILKSIDGIELACLVKEDSKDGKDQKLSFRSKTTIDVAEIAQEYGGGGHVRAAGATVKNMSNIDVYNMMIERLTK